MSSTKLRVKLKAYEHRTLDKACAKIVDKWTSTTSNRNSKVHNLKSSSQVQRLKRAI